MEGRVDALLGMQDHSSLAKFSHLWQMHLDAVDEREPLAVSASYDIVDEDNVAWRVRPPRFGNIDAEIALADDQHAEALAAVRKILIERGKACRFTGTIVIELPQIKKIAVATTNNPTNKKAPRKSRKRKESSDTESK